MLTFLLKTNDDAAILNLGLKKLGGGATGAGKADLRQAIEELEEKVMIREAIEKLGEKVMIRGQ